MTTEAAHNEPHGGKDHHPHVLPLPYYFGVWAMLLAFTGLTVGVSYFDFGGANLVIAILVATAKATMVAAIFMHLWWDQKIHALAFASSLVFLAIFVGFTMVDTETRGKADAIEGEHPADISQPFGNGFPSAASFRSATEAAAKKKWNTEKAESEKAGHRPAHGGGDNAHD